MVLRIAQKKHRVIFIDRGPARAATAMRLVRRGIRPAIIEKNILPRYHLRDSLTGATSVALRELGLGGAPEAQRYPIKHCVIFYGANGKNAFWVPIKRRNNENIQVPNQTWNLMRSTFDEVSNR